jgi:SAM-dependent methyltransferase
MHAPPPSKTNREGAISKWFLHGKRSLTEEERKGKSGLDDQLLRPPLKKNSGASRGFYDIQAQGRAAELKRYYHGLLQRYYVFIVPPGARVLELGCGIGDLLMAVRPARGVGVDFSPCMIDRAKQRHPHLEFHVAEAAEFTIGEQFDYIILSDLINDIPDLQQLFAHLASFAHPRSRIVINYFNSLWRPLLGLAEKCGFKSPTPPQNWLASADVQNLFYLTGWEVIRTERRIIWPVRTPFLESVLNRWVAAMPGFQHFSLSTFQISRLRPSAPANHYRCSVVIPARNEAGNIETTIQRLPTMGKGTEIIFIEGGSRDDTWNEIQSAIARHPERSIRLLKQLTNGKGGAVREAFAQATGEVLFILDADLSVRPEDLIKFYEVVRSGAADVVNGVRLVYPMEQEAMRFLNMVGNKFFSLAFSWLLGQPIKDTLCGTKVLFRSDYLEIARNRTYFGDFDPFGDFDLLFGAAKLNLRIADLPIRYQARSYGETNIQRWRHGWLLVRMVVFAARRIKFI